MSARLAQDGRDGRKRPRTFSEHQERGMEVLVASGRVRHAAARAFFAGIHAGRRAGLDEKAIVAAGRARQSAAERYIARQREATARRLA